MSYIWAGVLLPSAVHNGFGSLYDLSVFVLDTPGNKAPRLQGNQSGVRQLTGSMGRFTPLWFSQSRLSTEVSLCCVDLRRNPGAARLLQASCRSGFSTVFAFTADVAPHHRFVPDECLFSCQGAFLLCPVTTRLLRVIF